MTNSSNPVVFVEFSGRDEDACCALSDAIREFLERSGYHVAGLSPKAKTVTLKVIPEMT